MSLQIVSRARYTDLIELSTVQARLAPNVSSADDAYLQELIREASDAIVAYCNRPFARESYSEMVVLDGSEYMVLSRMPIESFTDPTVDGFEITGGIIHEEEDGILFREDRWIPLSTSINWSIFPTGNGSKKWATVAYVAGYLLPGQVQDWAATTAFVAGDFVQSSDSSVFLRFECTTAGDTGGSEPTWPTVAGDTVTDGTVVWTAREAKELPKNVVRAAWETVHGWYNTDHRDTEILQRRISEQDWLEYARLRGERRLPTLALGLLKNYRRQD